MDNLWNDIAWEISIQFSKQQHRRRWLNCSVLGGMLEGNNASRCQFTGLSGWFGKSGHHLKVIVAADKK